MAPERRDVVIVGGGPAGAALACFLRQRGRDVVLLDAALFPREKICGEGISPEAWRYLRAIGAEAGVRALAPRALFGMQLTSPDGTTFRGEYAGRAGPGFAVRRLHLDAVLLAAARAAGCEVHEATRATALLRRGAAVLGVTTDGPEEGRAWPARVVVGADGRRSVVARRLGLLREHRHLRRFAVRGYWDGMDGLGTVGEMHVGRGGYCGVAPLSDRFANVTFVLDRRDMAAASRGLESFYRSTLRTRWPRLAERLEPARLVEPPRAIGPLALEARGVAVAGALLIGDAAGFYDPFTGEGVTLALRAAERAAEAVDEALSAGPSGGGTLPPLIAYERSQRAATRDKFRFNRMVQTVVGFPDLANLVAKRLSRRPALADRLVGIAGDFVPARAALGVRFLLELISA